MIRKLILVASLGLASPLIHAGGASNAYRVAIEAREGSSTVIATPTAVVRPGVTWNMSVDGLEGFELTMQVTEMPEGKVKACGTFQSKHGNMSPCLELELGQKGTVTVGDQSLAITVSWYGS